MNSDSPLEELFRLASLAKIYDLEPVRYPGMPFFPTQAPGYMYFLHRRHSDSQADSSKKFTSGTSGMIQSADHVGTHVDAFCHIAYNGKILDTVDATNEIEWRHGYKKFGAETLPPIIIPGIMLDIPAMKGVDLLPEGYSITDADVEACCKLEKVSVGKDEAVLVRTGFGKLWNDPPKYVRAAGLSKEANQLFADSGVKLIGADNFTIDPSVPAGNGKERPHYAHEYCLPQKGIYLLETLNLEPLSEDKCYRFLLVCLPLKFQGATAGWARPIAMKL